MMLGTRRAGGASTPRRPMRPLLRVVMPMHARAMGGTAGPGSLSRTDRVALNSRWEFGMLHQPRSGEDRRKHQEHIGEVPYDLRDAWTALHEEKLPKTRNPIARILRKNVCYGGSGGVSEVLRVMLRACVELKLGIKQFLFRSFYPEITLMKIFFFM